MSEIFVLLWLADIVTTLKMLGILMLVGLGVLYLIGLMFVIEGDPEFFKRAWKSTKWSLLLAVPLALSPNSTTIKLLVASKAGELLLATEAGGKVVEAANALLTRIIKESKKE